MQKRIHVCDSLETTTSNSVIPYPLFRKRMNLVAKNWTRPILVLVREIIRTTQSQNEEFSQVSLNLSKSLEPKLFVLNTSANSEPQFIH